MEIEIHEIPLELISLKYREETRESFYFDTESGKLQKETTKIYFFKWKAGRGLRKMNELFRGEFSKNESKRGGEKKRGEESRDPTWNAWRTRRARNRGKTFPGQMLWNFATEKSLT